VGLLIRDFPSISAPLKGSSPSVSALSPRLSQRISLFPHLFHRLNGCGSSMCEDKRIKMAVLFGYGSSSLLQHCV
jgi:hypothetical protein